MLDICLILICFFAVFGAYSLIAQLLLLCLGDDLVLCVRLKSGMTVEELSSFAAACGRARKDIPVLLEERNEQQENALRTEGVPVYVRRP